MALVHLFALGAALLDLAGLFSHQAVLRFGSLHFNRLRMLAAAFLLVVMIAPTDGSFVLPMAFWQPVLLFVVVGVVLGDYFLFVAMRRLGPRCHRNIICWQCAYCRYPELVISGRDSVCCANSGYLCRFCRHLFCDYLWQTSGPATYIGKR